MSLRYIRATDWVSQSAASTTSSTAKHGPYTTAPLSGMSIFHGRHLIATPAAMPCALLCCVVTLGTGLLAACALCDGRLGAHVKSLWMVLLQGGIGIGRSSGGASSAVPSLAVAGLRFLSPCHIKDNVNYLHLHLHPANLYPCNSAPHGHRHMRARTASGGPTACMRAGHTQSCTA